jgi:hypothetical protein
MSIQFFSDHKDTIGGLAFIGGVVGISATLVQISNTNTTLQATNAYAIQKDARELTIALQNDVSFRDYVLRNEPNKPYAPELILDAKRGIGRLINFYLSVFRQYNAGGIAKGIAKSFGNDFCGTLRIKIVEDYWNSQIAAGVFTSEHAEMKNAWCP